MLRVCSSHTAPTYPLPDGAVPPNNCAREECVAADLDTGEQRSALDAHAGIDDTSRSNDCGQCLQRSGGISTPKP